MRRAYSTFDASTHEAFEDGMHQNIVNDGIWIENGIKVTYK